MLARTLSIAAFAFCLLVPSVGRSQDPTLDELKCEAASAKIFSKLAATYLKCFTKCHKADPLCAYPDINCILPALSKAFAGERSKCLNDCPECYAGGDCDLSHPSGRVDEVQIKAQTFGSQVYCDDGGSGDGLTALETKCQDGLAKTAGKLIGALGKCAAKCALSQAKGVTDGDCGGSGATDTKTVVCRTKALQKSITSIEKACYAPTANAPECLPAISSAAWVDGIRGSVDAEHAETFCEPACAFGTQVGGECWRIGDVGESCEDVCRFYSLPVDPATTAYAGSAGTDARCNAVLDAVGAGPGNLPFVATNCGIADECMLAVSGVNTQRARCLDTPANVTASSGFHRRACACTPPGALICCNLGSYSAWGDSQCSFPFGGLGVPGAPGTVPNGATGTCTPPPASGGSCCETSSECYSGGIFDFMCLNLGGTFFTNAICLAGGGCVPVP